MPQAHGIQHVTRLSLHSLEADHVLPGSDGQTERRDFRGVRHEAQCTQQPRSGFRRRSLSYNMFRLKTNWTYGMDLLSERQ
jgi:hypothetical protein